MPPRGYFRNAASRAENGSSKGRFMKTWPSAWVTKTLRPRAILEEARPLPRRVLGEVERAQDARLGPDELQHVALVEGVIAQRDHIGPGLEQGLGMGTREARARGRVLAVDHNEIEAPLLPQPFCRWP
jgi:hypothetical protein